MQSTDFAKFGHKCLSHHPSSRELQGISNGALSILNCHCFLQALFFDLSLHKVNLSEMYFFKYASKQTNIPSERCHLLPTLPLSSGHDLCNRFQSSVMSCPTRCIYKHSFQLHRCLLFLSPHCLQKSYLKCLSAVQVCQSNKCHICVYIYICVFIQYNKI